MKKIILVPLTMCLILVIVLAISAATLADIASETNTKAEQYFEKANELLKHTEYEAAIAEYNKVISLSSNSKIAQNAQYWIGQSHFRAGQFDAAQATFAKLIEQYPASAIVPVTKLMVERVGQAKKNEEKRKVMSNAADKGVIVDPDTGVRYTKTKIFTGKNDVIDVPTRLHLSPNGKFLLQDNLVIPLNGEEPFNLVDRQALRGIWSPDGKKVAFYSEGAIWVIPVSPNTGRVVGPAKKLLDGKYWFQRSVSWSPDSERIVFARRDETTDGDIWILSVKDGALKQITDDPLPEHRPQWSPDGKTIAYEKDDLSVWLVPAEGGTSRKIIDDVRRFSWSPDSKWLFYTTWQPRKHQFIRIADGRVLDITLPEGIGTFISWSPDGKLLFYRSSYDYTCILKVVSTSGGPSFQLGRDLGLWPYVHFWSPDSKMIITRGGAPIDMKYWDDLAFWIIPIEGGDAFPLKIDVSVIGKPYPRSLSHDGKKLLFAVPQSDTTEDLYVAPVSLEDARTTGPAVKVFSGRDKKPVGFGKMDEWAWSPDGSKLAVIHGGDIWITSAEEGKPVQITNTPEHEIWLVWSPDGEMIAYMFLRGEEPILHVISVSGGEAQEILTTPAGRDKYAWSPDSKEIAVISNGAISAISIAGGKARQILALKHQGFVDDKASGLSWLPDGKHLAFVSLKATGDDDPTRIFTVPAEGGQVTELAADDDGWKDWLYPSPNGKWISYGSEGEVKTRPEGAIWEADFDEILKKASE